MVLKLTGDGVYQWHTFYGSASTDFGYGIAVTGDAVYVTGMSGCHLGRRRSNRSEACP